MTSEFTDAQRAWIDRRPPRVREVIERVGPAIFKCLRGAGGGAGDGHYRLHALSEHEGGAAIEAGAVVTLKLIHGRDSFAPGVMVFGIMPDEVKPCGCGKWEQPTEDQVELMRQRLEVLRAARERA